MHLLVHKKNSSKYFRLDYRFADKRKTLTLGVYPETTLKQAREKRDLARKQIAEGIDPSENKKPLKNQKPQVRLTALKLSLENGAQNMLIIGMTKLIVQNGC